MVQTNEGKMKFMFKIIFINICFLTATAFADSEAIKSVPEFRGGLNISQIKNCEKKYAKLCPVEKSTMGTQQWPCIEKKMAKDKSCLQASKIRQHTGYPAIKFKKYGHVTVFTFSTIADGVDVFYMVDTKGQLIALNTEMNLSGNNHYVALKKKYPEIALTGFLYWTKINEDLFPKAHSLPNKNQQLIFKQELRSPDCVACANVGVVEMAYEFDPKGVYLSSKVLSITPMK